MGDHILTGVLVPLPTQMAHPGVPDPELAARHLEALAQARVDGLMLLGSNGEGALVLPRDTREYVLKVARRWRAARPGGRLVVTVSAPGTSEAVERARLALDATPDAFALTAPSYFRHRPDEILRHVDAVADLGVPVVVYHLPRIAGPLVPEVVESLVADQRVIGIKDSSGDIEGLAAIVAAAAGRPGFAVSQGDEIRLLEGLDRGAAGLLPGTANLAPDLAVGLYEAWRRGDRDAAVLLQELTTALTTIHRVRPGVPTVKRILSERGFGSPVVAEPLVPCTDPEYARLRTVLAPLEEHLIRPAAAH